MSKNARLALGGLVGLCILLFGSIVLVMINRQRHAARIAETQSLVAPSDDYLAHAEAEAQSGDETDDEFVDEFDDGENYADSEEPTDWQDAESVDDQEFFDAPQDEDAPDNEVGFETEDEPALQDEDDYRN